MSLTLGQDEIFLSRKTRQTSTSEQQNNVHHGRRRTVSTGFEQSRCKGSFADNRKAHSFSKDIPFVTKNILRKISTLESFQENLENLPEKIPVAKLTWLKQLPGFSIVLNIIGVIIFQFGNVLAKNVEMDLVLMLLMRDILITSQMAPFTIHYGENLPPKGKKLLLVVHGVIAGLHNLAHFYAVNVLPLGDVMMVSAVKPIFITFFSCVFLKEACRIFEIVNLFLVLGGIVLVVQPPLIFGDSNQEYTTHMFYTAMVLMASNAMVSFTAIISRHLRDTHWSVMCLSSKVISTIQLLGVCIYFGTFCLPECGLIRFNIIILSFIAYITQALYIICLQHEEAHIIGLSDNASNIIVSQIFQIIFFSQIPKTLKVVGFLLVLASMIMLGGKKIWDSKHKKTDNGDNEEVIEH